jgi:hypothetical protein
MLEEAPDELHDIQGEDSVAVTVRFAVANEDSAASDPDDARIGESDFEDVRGEIFETSLAWAHGLAVDVPLALPDLRGDLVEEPIFFHRIAELGFKDHRKRSHGQIEVDSRGVPETISGGESTAGDDVMDVGVIFQGTTPGVEDTKEAREVASDMAFIEGEFFDGLGGGPEKGRISMALVFPDEASQFVRDGKGEEEVVSRELAVDLFFPPQLGLLLLTGGAMAVSTGAIDLVEAATLLALVDGDAGERGATGDHGIDDFAVCVRHERAIAARVLGAEGPHYLIDGGHGAVPPSPD